MTTPDTDAEKAREVFNETALVADDEACEAIIAEALRQARREERQRCHDIALSIDSNRGNEKEIARAIKDTNP